MRELRNRAEMIIRIICLVLAGVLVGELAHVAIWLNPFHGTTIPELPVLSAAADAGTNQNLKGAVKVAAAGTNAAPATNQANDKVVLAGTNAGALLSNVVAAAQEGTNVAMRGGGAKLGTNSPVGVGTNAVAVIHSNAPPAAGSDPQAGSLAPPAAMMAGAGMPPGFPPGMGGPPLPKALQSRIDRIVESEIFAPIMHPLPMALLGIAGDCAFLRSASGQTGLVKEGDSLGDIKLLRIGTNRVLVEQGELKQELMIFSGYGGDSLMPNNSTNEIHHP
jgi:hypothetical protein